MKIKVESLNTLKKIVLLILSVAFLAFVLMLISSYLVEEEVKDEYIDKNLEPDEIIIEEDR